MQIETRSVTIRTLRHSDENRLGEEIAHWHQDGWYVVSHQTTAVPYRWSGKGLKGQDHVLVFQRDGASPAPRQNRKVAITFGEA